MTKGTGPRVKLPSKSVYKNNDSNFIPLVFGTILEGNVIDAAFKGK